MDHEMILLDADFRTVCARMTARRKQNAPLAQQEERGFRTPEIGVRGVDGAPDLEEEGE